MLAQVITFEVVVDVAENRVVLDEGRRCARSPTEVPGIEHGIADIDRVAEVARVTEVMPGRDRGGIGGRERRKECMTVREEHALAPDAEQRRRIRRVDGPGSETVGDEDDHVAPRGECRKRRYR